MFTKEGCAKNPISKKARDIDSIKNIGLNIPFLLHPNASYILVGYELYLAVASAQQIRMFALTQNKMNWKKKTTKYSNLKELNLLVRNTVASVLSGFKCAKDQLSFDIPENTDGTESQSIQGGKKKK